MTHPLYAEYLAFLAQVNERIRERARTVPPFTETGEVVCYRVHGNEDCHVAIGAFAVRKGVFTLVTLIGADSADPGLLIGNVPPEALMRCGCGKWAQPTAAQLEATQAAMLRKAAERGIKLGACTDPSCACKLFGREHCRIVPPGRGQT